MVGAPPRLSHARLNGILRGHSVLEQTANLCYLVASFRFAQAPSGGFTEEETTPPDQKNPIPSVGKDPLALGEMLSGSKETGPPLPNRNPSRESVTTPEEDLKQDHSTTKCERSATCRQTHILTIQRYIYSEILLVRPLAARAASSYSCGDVYRETLLLTCRDARRTRIGHKLQAWE